MATPVKLEPKPVDFFESAHEVRVAEDRAIFREVQQEVRYQDFSDWMPVEEFEALCYLVMLDRWSQLSEAQKLHRLKHVDSLPALRGLRRRKNYMRVAGAIEEAWERVATPQTLTDHVADLRTQDRMARRTKRIALYGTDLREVNKALERMQDRQMPKTVNIKEQRSIMISSRDMEVLAEVEADRKRLPESRAAHEDLVEGEVLDAAGE